MYFIFSNCFFLFGIANNYRFKSKVILFLYKQQRSIKVQLSVRKNIFISSKQLYFTTELYCYKKKIKLNRTKSLKSYFVYLVGIYLHISFCIQLTVHVLAGRHLNFSLDLHDIFVLRLQESSETVTVYRKSNQIQIG